jgi:FAD/FMN-containing dehydrogenase
VAHPIPDFPALQRTIAGDVVLPDSAEYEVVRKPAIAWFDGVRPQAAVRCQTPKDVAETIRFARRYGIPAAVRSGGHCFAGRSSTTGILIDTTPMSFVSVADDTAVVGGGTRLAQVYDALAEHGRTIPAGCGPTVGIAGLTLGGGHGILGRRYGLTCDRLTGAEVVLANGQLVQCDDHHEPELFWALRGAGGGNFGVATSLTFATLPAPTATALQMMWRDNHAAAVITAWQMWAPDAPEELAASLLVTVPRAVSQPLVATVRGAMIGNRSDAETQLGELVALVGTSPEAVDTRELPYRDTKRYLVDLDPAEDGEPTHGLSTSEYFRRPLPAEAVTALMRHLSTNRVQGQSRGLDFTPWAGAYNRVPADATAFVHREERFLLKQEVTVDSAASTAQPDAAREWFTRARALAHQWGTGRSYPNFPDPDLEDWAAAYYGTNYERLVRVKQRYDPEGFFGGVQSLPLTA